MPWCNSFESHSFSTLEALAMCDDDWQPKPTTCQRIRNFFSKVKAKATKLPAKLRTKMHRRRSSPPSPSQSSQSKELVPKFDFDWDNDPIDRESDADSYCCTLSTAASTPHRSLSNF
ncbi:hypothetical protein MMC20_001843 [Loxospora ochrophaea]|nr:hypothetical protein [Loxospora ochrophaea]